MVPKVILPIGLPACGKSTWADKMAIEGFIRHSSDRIRLEFGMKYDDPMAFQILHKRIKEDLRNGKNCIYDATNLSRKRRRQFLEELKKIPCEKEAKLFLVPLDVCMERNRLRSGGARVPDLLYMEMLKSFHVPDQHYEGFDRITFEAYNGEFILPDYENLDDFSQDNPHHTESLGEHMKLCEQAVYQLMGDNEQYKGLLDPKKLGFIARYHDIGKVHTKVFHNSKGEVTKDAHYYGHDNVGAYMFLMKWLQDTPESFREETFETALTIANVINWHMAPHTVWKQSERRLKNDRMWLDPELVKAIDILYEADKMASKSIERSEEYDEIDRE